MKIVDVISFNFYVLYILTICLFICKLIQMPERKHENMNFLFVAVTV